jgi:hypothetical protein
MPTYFLLSIRVLLSVGAEFRRSKPTSKKGRPFIMRGQVDVKPATVFFCDRRLSISDIATSRQLGCREPRFRGSIVYDTGLSSLRVVRYPPADLNCNRSAHEHGKVCASMPAVSTWIAGFFQAGLISETTSQLPESDRNRKSPRPAPRALPHTAWFSLPAHLDTASNTAATTGASAAAVRDKLDPKCAFSSVVRGAVGAAQCIHAGLGSARGCAGVSR